MVDELKKEKTARKKRYKARTELREEIKEDLLEQLQERNIFESHYVDLVNDYRN